ncbi:N-alpha-acetyltransferase 15, NatA auxiliary subunit [Corchorus olitorius]|uniref:N-alpha-acetyltransferase 15, NatA auxiliary subunit n=1 Tax=Corchorus olitorius TaxID=93759 RepID=A0A1R3I9D2_9ROSI|nr:N-alpha-acetyltransferase 15, NatA auxiliary subunit [Corchorus olitorius]
MSTPSDPLQHGKQVQETRNHLTQGVNSSEIPKISRQPKKSDQRLLYLEMMMRGQKVRWRGSRIRGLIRKSRSPERKERLIVKARHNQSDIPLIRILRGEKKKNVVLERNKKRTSIPVMS